jgi:hypothetical protein
MAAAAKKSTPAKKAAPAPKPAPAKAPAAKKAPAKKAAAPSPKPAGRVADPEKVAAREAKAAEVAARKAARTEATSAIRQRVVEMRSNGSKWPEIAGELNISTGKAMLEYEYATAGTVETPTPAKVKAARDSGMSWAAIMARFSFATKGSAQKMYAETGADPQASYIGKGGRYFGHEDKIAGQRAEKAASRPAAAPKATKETKSVFAEDAVAADIVAKINGKKITTKGPEKLGGPLTEIKVKDGSVKVARTKSGTRVVQLTNGATGGAHTIALASIVRVGR